jgi:succinate dehydrogenase / fumarate reductase, membrane anchor subunit
MTKATGFDSGRSGRGGAYTADRSGAAHAKFMKQSARALAPLAFISAWALIGVVGEPYEAARHIIGRPVPALALIGFIALGSVHARYGMETIIDDYVHEPAMKELALKANKWTSIAIAAAWLFAILLIAAPK